MGENIRRRRRIRSEPEAEAQTAAIAESAGPTGEDRDAERGLRGLVGGGSSQLSVGAALRARDAARPGEAELDEAQRNMVIVRRGWTPPA